jgi:nucleoside 2-deoxyribosyltransferase
MLKVYIAASLTDKDKALALRLKLVNAGIQVTSQWIFEAGVNDPIQNQSQSEYLEKLDLGDIDRSDLLIFMSGTTKSPGKTTEIGYAIGIRKPIFFLGSIYSVFHWNSSIYRWDSEEAMLNWLSQNKEIVKALLS